MSAGPARSARIPVTVLTGWLGAGKTTLLNRILHERHGRRYAVIVNEFGEAGIDGDLVIASDEELVELSNGCICCTVRGDLVRTLHALLARDEDLEGIVVETTGLADPGPVAQTFLVDPRIAARTELDAIVTLVDARHAPASLDHRAAREQVAFADRLVLNKTELVDEAALRVVERRLRALNPLAPILRTQRAAVPLDEVLGQRAFDLARIAAHEPDVAAHVHDEHCDHGHEPRHDDDIASVSVVLDRPLDARRVSAWLETLVARQGADILRGKGILDVAGDDRRLVFHSVHMLLEGDYERRWRDGERRESRLVFIGRHLDPRAVRDGVEACVA